MSENDRGRGRKRPGDDEVLLVGLAQLWDGRRARARRGRAGARGRRTWEYVVRYT